jgi:MscS family membrane protein
MKKYLCFFLLASCFMSACLYAQEPTPVDEAEVNLNTPYHTLYTHLANLQEDQYRPEIAAQTFSLQERSTQEAAELAIKLKQILDGEGIFIDMDLVPREPGYTDTLSGQQKYVLHDRYPDIYLVRKPDGRWLYSEKAAANIEAIYQTVFPLGTHKLLDLLPRFGHKRVMGLHLWQYLAAFILILLAFVLHKLFTFIFRKGLIHLLHNMGYEEVARKFVLPVARPFSLLMVTVFLLMMSPVLQLPAQMSYWLFLFLRAALPFFATVVFYKLIDLVGVYLQRYAGRTENTLDDQLVPLVRKAMRTFVVIVGALFILDNLDFNVTAFIAGLSIGGLAFALAAQDTIKNFFGSLMIFIDKPFQIGDWITSGEIDGTVEEVGFRSTRIRTFRNSVTYVPNGKLADWVVDNHGLRRYRRFYTRLALTYDTPTHVVDLFVEGLKKIVQQHPKTRKDYYEVHLNDLGAHSLDVMFYIFFAVPSWSEELRARHEVLLQVMELAEVLGVRFAFPTQTLHMETFPGKPGLTPEYQASVAELQAARDAYLQGRPAAGAPGMN